MEIPNTIVEITRNPNMVTALLLLAENAGWSVDIRANSDSSLLAGLCFGLLSSSKMLRRVHVQMLDSTSHLIQLGVALFFG